MERYVTASFEGCPAVHGISVTAPCRVPAKWHHQFKVVFSRVMSWTWCSQFSIALRPRSQPATCPATSRGISRYFSSAVPGGALSLTPRAMCSV